MPSEVAVVERHLEIVGGVVQYVDGHGALTERRGVSTRQHDAGERNTAEKAGDMGPYRSSQYSASARREHLELYELQVLGRHLGKDRPVWPGESPQSERNRPPSTAR